MSTNLRFWRVADGGQYRSVHQHGIYRRWYWREFSARKRRRDITSRTTWRLCPPAALTPIITRVLYFRHSPKSGRYRSCASTSISCFPWWGIGSALAASRAAGPDGSGEQFCAVGVWRSGTALSHVLQLLCVVGLLRSVGNPVVRFADGESARGLSALNSTFFKTFLFISNSHWRPSGGGDWRDAGVLVVQIIPAPFWAVRDD